MVRHHLVVLMLLVLSALGCAKPLFTYDVPADASLQSYSTIAIDPRTDRLFLTKGKRPLNDPETKSLVLSELQAKGYRLAPAEQADLWVGALLFMESHEPSHMEISGPGSSHGGGHGSMGHGGHTGGSAGDGGHASGEAHSKGAGLSVLVELIARSSLERVWAGMGDLALSAKEPKSHGSGHDQGHALLESTVKQLLEPLPGKPSQ